MTIEELFKKGIEELRKYMVEDPILKVRMLLCHVLKVSKEYLVIHHMEQISKERKEEFEEKLLFIIQGKPIQYITHHQEFMKLNFYVDENVLIPRADTEITVEAVIEYCKKDTSRRYQILDLCTGSGAIAIALAKYIPNCEIEAVDISKEALEVAKKNAEQNQVLNIKWICSYLFENISNTFDIIVSNPPYIQTKVIKSLSKEVQNEPILALDGGKDGLVFYKDIIQNGEKYLKEKGVIFLEIGYDQKDQIINLVQQAEKYSAIVNKKDLGGNDRMIMIRK